MIFYKAIKYSLLNLCLNALFDGLVKNFSFAIRGGQILYLKDLYNGFCFREFHFIFEDGSRLILKNCQILNIYNTSNGWYMLVRATEDNIIGKGIVRHHFRVMGDDELIIYK